jgi:hypothetical protein
LPREEMCLLLLLGGMSQAAAARALHIHPMTVWRWMREGTLFNTIYQERLQQLWESHRREASAVLKASLEGALNLASRRDLRSLEEGITLFLKAKERLPPYFQPCPSDYEGQCPHIPGPCMTAIEQLRAAIGSALMQQDEWTKDMSDIEIIERLSRLGHRIGEIWSDSSS